MNSTLYTLRKLYLGDRRKLVISTEQEKMLAISPGSTGGPLSKQQRKVLLDERLRVVTPRASEWLDFSVVEIGKKKREKTGLKTFQPSCVIE